VAGGWRRLDDEGLHNLHASPDINRLFESKMKWVRNVARMGEMRNAYRRSERNIPLERSRNRG
jgi:hypothetical protein